nr:MAG TPA: hypothetical protein [Caudoviricetes sp.]
MSRIFSHFSILKEISLKRICEENSPYFISFTYNLDLVLCMQNIGKFQVCNLAFPHSSSKSYLNQKQISHHRVLSIRSCLYVVNQPQNFRISKEINFSPRNFWRDNPGRF